MQATITTLSQFNFHDVVTLMWRIMNEGEGEGSYKRVSAEEYIKGNSDNIRVLEGSGAVLGMYSYSDNPNVFTLNFFALSPIVRGKRAGYKLFVDLKRRLVRKPVIIPLYNHNELISELVKKRGTFVGRYRAEGGSILDYYSVAFDGGNW